MSTILEKTFSSPTALLKAAQDLLRAELQRAASQPRAIMISGGRTPLPVYHDIARAPFPPASNVKVCFSDERHVPVDSTESNYGNARPMLDALRLPQERILRIRTELPLEQAAADYDAALSAFLQSGGRIAVALLGIGPDGHTCSLFSDADLERARGHYAIPVTGAQPPHRVTVTPSLLARVERVVFLVADPDKDPIIRQLLEAPMSVVAGKAVADCPHVELWRA